MKKINLILFFAVLLHAQEVTSEQYSVELRNAPITDAIRLLVFMDHKNVVIPGDLSGTVIASFPGINLQDALNSILNSNQLVSYLTNDVLEISTKKTEESLGKDLSTKSFHLNYTTANVVGPQVKALVSDRSSVLTDSRSNITTIRGTKEDIKSVETLISNIDRLDKQVLIEAKIVQASKKFTRDFGIQWGVNHNSGTLNIGGLPAAGSAASGRPLNVGGPGSSNPLSGIGAALGPFGSTFLDAQLSMGEENGELSILSRPSIVTMNNQPATIRSGLTFYIKTAGNVTISSGASGTSGGSGTSGASGASGASGSSGASGASGASGTAAGSTPASGASTGGTTLSQIVSGITLVVTPHITPDNKISLIINVVSSQPDFSKMVDGIPAIADNTATTTVLLDNGATTVIGGLAELTDSKSKSGVPWISKIPVLNLLFGKSSKEKSNRELLIFITPKVVQEAVKELKGFSGKNLNKDDG